jgi:hypothetical protein
MFDRLIAVAFSLRLDPEMGKACEEESGAFKSLVFVESIDSTTISRNSAIKLMIAVKKDFFLKFNFMQVSPFLSFIK